MCSPSRPTSSASAGAYARTRVLASACVYAHHLALHHRQVCLRERARARARTRARVSACMPVCSPPRSTSSWAAGFRWPRLRSTRSLARSAPPPRASLPRPSDLPARELARVSACSCLLALISTQALLALSVALSLHTYPPSLWLPPNFPFHLQRCFYWSNPAALHPPAPLAPPASA